MAPSLDCSTTDVCCVHRTERHLFMIEVIGSSPESRVFGQKTGAHDFENGQPPCSCECQNTLRNYSRSHTYRGLRGASRYRLADRPGHLHRWRSHDTAGDLRCTDQRKRVEHLQPILQKLRAVAFHPSWADRDKAEDSSGWVTKRRPRPTWLAQKTASLPSPLVFSEPQGSSRFRGSWNRRPGEISNTDS